MIPPNFLAVKISSSLLKLEDIRSQYFRPLQRELRSFSKTVLRPSSHEFSWTGHTYSRLLIKNEFIPIPGLPFLDVGVLHLALLGDVVSEATFTAAAALAIPLDGACVEHGAAPLELDGRAMDTVRAVVPVARQDGDGGGIAVGHSRGGRGGGGGGGGVLHIAHVARTVILTTTSSAVSHLHNYCQANVMGSSNILVCDLTFICRRFLESLFFGSRRFMVAKARDYDGKYKIT